MCELINKAERSIDLAAYAVSARWQKLATDKYNVYQALLDAPARGVRCRCVIATHKRTAVTSRFNIYSSRALAEKKWLIRHAPRSKLMHMKMIIVDNLYVVVGSHNISRSAAASNIDLSLCLIGNDVAKKHGEIFNKLFAISYTKER